MGFAEAEWAEISVVVFAKSPTPGRVKTRLAADVGAEEACAFYEAFLRDVATMVARALPRLGAPASAVLAYAGDGPGGLECFAEAGFGATGQGGGGLGERLARVTARAFAGGARKVVIVGTDSPTLPPRLLADACVRLDDAAVVLGPSFDGGYYLVGLSEPAPTIFEGIDWSSREVLGQTLRRCRQANALSELLEFWYDVDDLDDLTLLHDHLFDYLRSRDPDVARHTAAHFQSTPLASLIDRR